MGDTFFRQSPCDGMTATPRWSVIACLLAVAVFAPTTSGAQQAGAGVIVERAFDQGWTTADRQAFYTTSQGSRLIPYAWLKALRRLDVDEPFLGDQLQRYGYLPNPVSAQNPEGLPVGFVIDPASKPAQIGMTCAACHTGQLEYRQGDTTYVFRVDGAPTLAVFQTFLADLAEAARATAESPERFRVFARAVLGVGHSPQAASALKASFSAWTDKFVPLMGKSLPAMPWGPGRLDAFGMIFNRVTGHDLGITENLRPADAPVSYPFLWNASRQDKTQWNGAALNGLFVTALGRNTGEVFGVFADLDPVVLKEHRPLRPPIIKYSNSADIRRLQLLEEKIVALKPPR